MPFRPGAPIMTVDAGKMHNIDTRNVENLFGMWSVFSKCSATLEDGKRLENLSWRLWTRETFCCAPEKQKRLTHHISFDHKSRRLDSTSLPELSSSVDSASTGHSDDADTESSVATTPAEVVRPEIRRLDSDDRRIRGREKHITPIDLEKMVMSIKENKDIEPLSPLRMRKPVEAPVLPPPIPSCTSQVNTASVSASSPTPRASESSTSTVAMDTSRAGSEVSPAASDTTTASGSSPQSVVRGFELGRISSSYRSSSQLAPQPTPILKTSVSHQPEKPKKKGGMFMLPGSSEEDSSFDNHMSFRPGRSSLSEGLKDNSRRPGQFKKKTSFKDEVATRTIQEAANDAVFDSDEEDEDEPDESAIEEDDDEDWEDSATESGRSSVEERQLFQRVDSRPNLTSRRSLLTTLMHEPDRAAALQNQASRSTPAMRRSRTSSPNGPSVAASPDDEQLLKTRGAPIGGSKPIIMTTSSVHPPALSPRTTRRNMLATELTESLRKHLLHERKQKNMTVEASIKRRHTSHDVQTLQQFPEPGQSPRHASKDTSKNNSWNYFDYGLGEYHQRGW